MDRCSTELGALSDGGILGAGHLWPHLHYTLMVAVVGTTTSLNGGAVVLPSFRKNTVLCTSVGKEFVDGLTATALTARPLVLLV